MAWPASDVGTTNTDAGTDSPATARSNLLDLMQKFNLLRNHVIPVWQNILALGAYTPSLTPVHSATPTFDAAASNVHEPATLTGNVSSMTITNAAAGRTINIRFQQDATGGRTVAVPAGAAVTGSINVTANKVSWLCMTYSSRGARWEGSWMYLP